MMLDAERLDRFDRLVPPVRLLDFGIGLMDSAFPFQNSGPWQSYLQYRDGLIIALISLWPIRRRSLATLTVSGHLSFDDSGVVIRLAPADTKANREEVCRLPGQLAPYFRRYVDEVRPAMLGDRIHDGLWPSREGRPMSGGRIYDTVRHRIRQRFGKDMGIHDMRRAVATYIAIDMPDKVGLIPGVLQQANPEVGEQHYNLANAMSASRRYAATLANLKASLRTKADRKRDPS
jgi:hypothetical protein